MWNLYYTFEFNYVIVGHVNDRSRKIEAGCAFRDVYSRTTGRVGAMLEIRDTWRYEMRKNCSILSGAGIGLSIVGQGCANCARAIFSRSREYLPISVANSHTACYPLSARRQLFQSRYPLGTRAPATPRPRSTSPKRCTSATSHW